MNTHIKEEEIISQNWGKNLRIKGRAEFGGQLVAGILKAASICEQG
jgi:hypothetical protein